MQNQRLKNFAPLRKNNLGHFPESPDIGILFQNLISPLATLENFRPTRLRSFW